MAVKRLNSLAMSDKFSVITGGDTFAFQKPDGRHLLKTIERAHGQIAHSIMIGDSVNDIVAAQYIDIPSIAVPFGFSPVPVKTLNRDTIISHYDQLTPDLIETIFNKRLFSNPKNIL